MALTPNFTATQLLGLPNIIVLTDTSSGSDGNVTSRRVYLRDAYNNNVLPDGTVTDYVEWDIGESSINIDCLTKDMALNITVEWIDANDVALYSKLVFSGFTSYNEDFLYQLAGFLAVNYKRTADADFVTQMFKLRNYVDSGDQAVIRGGDIAKAQACYDIATNIRENSAYFFNTN
jgi:hypothetical protein